MQSSFDALDTLSVGSRDYSIFALDSLAKHGAELDKLPFSLRILLENLLRTEDGVSVTADDVLALAKWSPTEASQQEIAFTPARVLLQDFTGVPCVVDLAAMRDAMAK